MALKKKDYTTLSGTSLQNGVNISPNVNWGGYDVTPTFKDTSWMNQRNSDGGSQVPKGSKESSLLSPTLGITGANALLGGAKVAITNSPSGGSGGGGGGYGYIPTYNPYARYASPYQGKIDALMDALLNRDPFSYDYLSDPVYQSYRQQYEFQGDRARENAIGDYAANTGGLASSWANTAGQLRQNNYNAQLNGLIPELENARYNRYLGEIETDLNNLGQLQNLENMNYDRYLNDRNYDLQLQQLAQSGRRSRSRSSGGGSSSSKSTANDTSYRTSMLQDFIDSGLDVESYIRQNLGALTDDDMTYLRKNKDLATSTGGGMLGDADGGESKTSSGKNGLFSSFFNRQLGTPEDEYEKRRRAALRYAGIKV